MNIGDWIAVLSFIFSIIAIIIASKSKKFELSSGHYNERLAWYKDTIRIVITLKSNKYENKNELLCKLSAQIEIGRFFFPNIITGDDYGKNKPKAYKGYRDIINDLLVFLYQIFEKSNAQDYIEHVNVLQNLYTSCVFERLDPVKHNKFIKRNTYLPISKVYSIDELLNKNPEAIEALFPITSHEEKGH